MAGIKLSLEQVRGLLPVSKHRLDDELELQADMFERISAVVTQKNSHFLEAKDELARIEGRLLEDIREADGKVTVDVANSRVRRASERIRAWDALQDARASLEAWQGAQDAWRQKGFSIKTLADLYAAQYFTVTPANLTNRRERAEDTEERRAAMREANHVEPRRRRDDEGDLPRRGSR